jgi:vacuolar iron transporter family protein
MSTSGGSSVGTVGPESAPGRHPNEPHHDLSRLNWLRAGVLGANDGIVSVAGLVVGVAGATTSRAAVLAAGVAGLAAGAVSMALGEYVSVSSQRDSERALLALERRELAEDPEAEFEELVAIYRDKGLSESTARSVAQELTEHDALAAHADAELNLDPEQLANPWQAALASAISFSAGALLPLVMMLLTSPGWRVPATAIATIAALALTGFISARLGGSQPRRAMIRVVIGGAIALIVTYAIGRLFGAAVG